MTITAIETRYSGHRFRSRLEARWAVFFDALGIRWEYEPQGYLVGHDRKPYLPDFWLPKEKVWVEVKGSEDQLDVELLVDAALPWHGLPATANNVGEHDVRLLILGPISSGVKLLEDKAAKEHIGYTQPTYTALTFRKGDLFQGTASFHATGLWIEPEGGLIANDSPDIYRATRGTDWGNWVGGGCLISDSYEQPVAAAYRAARSARFEHGEHGA